MPRAPSYHASHVRRKAKDTFKIHQYPFRHDDEDDVQDFKAKATAEKPKPAVEPYDAVPAEKHLPPGARIADESGGGQKRKRDDGPGGAAPALKARKLYDVRGSGDPRVRPRNVSALPKIVAEMSELGFNQDDMQFGYANPRPFEELMDYVTEYHLRDGIDYQIFPFHIMRGSDYLWLCLGKRRTGKTTLWKNVIPKLAPMYPYAYLFAQTSFNNAFGQYAPKDAIFPGFSEGIIRKIVDAQQRKIDINLRLFERYSEQEDPQALEKIENPYVHLNFDDNVADPRLHSSEALKELAMYGRHFRTGVWINR